MIYFLAVIAALVLCALAVAVWYRRKAAASGAQAAYQAQRAAAAEASVQQIERTADAVAKIESRHVAEQKISDEKITHGDRDHLAGDW